MKCWSMLLFSLGSILLGCSHMSPHTPQVSEDSSPNKEISQNADWIWPVPSNQKRVEFSSLANGRAYLPSYSGAHVLSVSNGEVVFAGRNLKAFGQTIVIQHQNGLYSVYGNLKNHYVDEKEKVHQGQVIGRIGPRAKRREGEASKSLGELVFEARYEGQVVSFESLYTDFQEIQMQED